MSKRVPPKTAATIAFSEDIFSKRLVRCLGRNAAVHTCWETFEQSSAHARTIVIAQSKLDDGRGSLESAAKLILSLAGIPVVIATELTEANVDALSALRFDRFVSVANMEEKIPAIIAELAARGQRESLARVLAERATTKPVRAAISHLFASSAVPRCDSEVAVTVGCSTECLRRSTVKELRLTLYQLRRRARLLLAVELWNVGVRHPELGYMVGVETSTLNRDAKAILGSSFGAVVDMEPYALAEYLLRSVG